MGLKKKRCYNYYLVIVDRYSVRNSELSLSANRSVTSLE